MNPSLPTMIISVLEKMDNPHAANIVVSEAALESLPPPPRIMPTFQDSIYPLPVSMFCGIPVYVDPSMMPGYFLVLTDKQIAEHLTRMATAQAFAELATMDRKHA